MRGWMLLLEGATMLCELADRAIGEDLGEIGASIAQRARDLLERSCLEVHTDIHLGGESYGGAMLAITRLCRLEARLRGLERVVEQQRRDRARCSVS